MHTSKSGQTASFRALVVEDDDVLPRFIRHALLEVHGTTDSVATAREAFERIERTHYDVVLVDLRLPDLSGLEFVRDIRTWTAIPVIMMTASGHEHDLLDALRAGVDDYVVKPFSTVEIGLRVQNVLRRKRVHELPLAQIQVGNVVAMLQSKRLEVAGVQVDVTPIEFRMFVLFARHLGQVLSHERILAEMCERNCLLPAQLVSQSKPFARSVTGCKQCRLLHNDASSPACYASGILFCTRLLREHLPNIEGKSDADTIR
jgi:two-component system KDP operon response regulator KdpE